MGDGRDFRTRLRHTLAALDAEALAALGSKGLLRRAQKDVAGGAVRGAREGSGEALAVDVGDAVVTLTAVGPAKATCTCPAPGVCRHILAATLFLQKELSVDASGSVSVSRGDGASAPSGSPDPSPDEMVPPDDATRTMADPDTLRRWAGKVALRTAARLVERGSSVAPDPQGGAVVRFPSEDRECHLLPGAGLDGVIVSGAPLSQDHSRALVAAAVLAWMRHQGMPTGHLTAGPAVALPRAGGAPRSIPEVLDAATSLLAEVAAVGFSHLSSSAVERLTTLSVSAQGVSLPRLAHHLRRLAREGELLLERHAQADEERLLREAANAFALVESLRLGGEAALSRLAGESRTAYEDVGTLELAGLAAHGWRTRSGYRGLTLLFWDLQALDWVAWTDARPSGTAEGFDPKQRYGQSVPWRGTASPRDLMGRRLVLDKAKLNPARRLSGATGTRLRAAEPIDPCDIAFGAHQFRDWHALRQYAASLVPVGFASPAALAEVVVVEPTRWGERGFDQVRQTFVWALEDERGDVLPLEVVHSEDNDDAISSLEAVRPLREDYRLVVGSLVRSHGRVALLPYALLRPTRGDRSTTLCLTLDGGPRQGLLKRLASGVRLGWQIARLPGLDALFSDADAFGPIESEESLPPMPPPMADLSSLLARIGERGVSSLGEGDRATLAACSTDLETMGLGILGGHARRLGSASDLPAAYLRLCHLLERHRLAQLRMALAET